MRSTILAVVLSLIGAACGSSGKPQSSGVGGGAGGVTVDGGAGADGAVGGAAGDAGGNDARTTFTLGGVATGIVGKNLAITSGTETLPLTENGRFVFTMALPNGAGYSVTIQKQPDTPTQSCYVLNGSGTIAGADVDKVIVSCVPSRARYVLITDLADSSVSTYAIVDATGRIVFIGKATAGANPTAVSVAASGKSAYVANSGDGTVSQYTVGADGTLTPMAPATVNAGTGVRRLALDPAGRFAYAVNPGSGNVTAYSVAANGALTRIGMTPVGMSPQAITMDPGGQFVYVVNSSDNNISQLKVGADGSLAAMTPSTVAAGAAPGAITVDRTGRFLYVANVTDGTVSQFAIGTTGALSPLSPATFTVGASPTAIRTDATGHFAYVTRGGTTGTIAQLAIGPRGTLSSLTPATATVEADPQAIAIDGNGGFVYVVAGTSNSITAFDVIPTSGALSALPRVPGQGSPSSVAIVAGDAPVQAVTKFAYAANNGGDSISLFTVGASGALTISGSLNVGGTGPQGITVDPSNSHLYVANNTTNNLSQYAIGTDGKLAALAPDGVDAGVFPVAIAFHPSGRFAYAVNQDGHSVSQYAAAADGTLRALTPATVTVSTNTGPSSIVADPTGRYVFVSITTGNVARFSVGVDGTLSSLTPATVPAGMNSAAVAVSPSGASLFVANSSSNNISQYASRRRRNAHPAHPRNGHDRDVPDGAGGGSEWSLAVRRQHQQRRRQPVLGRQQRRTHRAHPTACGHRYRQHRQPNRNHRRPFWPLPLRDRLRRPDRYGVAVHNRRDRRPDADDAAVGGGRHRAVIDRGRGNVPVACASWPPLLAGLAASAVGGGAAQR